MTLGNSGGGGGVTKLSSSRAELICRVWQGISFIEEIREALRTAPQTDPVAVALTAATHQLVIAAGLLTPRLNKPQLEASETGDRRSVGA